MKFLEHKITTQSSVTKPVCSSPPKPTELNRQRRSAGLCVSGVDAVGLFAGGLAVDGANECGLRGFFGHGQNQLMGNVENIRSLADFMSKNFLILRDCDHLLFANQQRIFNLDTVSFLPAISHASIRNY